MSAPTLPSKGQAAVENELLKRLGLPPSASPEDVDDLHQAVSEYLATAPASIRGWAHAQAAALDAAYLQLTDPVGLQGSALRSPTRPPTVVPGGPATPPARRDPVPAVALHADRAGDDADDDADETETFDDVEDPGLEGDGDDDFDALYASVTPSAHTDMGPDRRPRAAASAVARPAARSGVAASTRSSGRATRKAQARRARAAAVPPPVASAGPLKAIVLGGLVVAASLAIAVVGYNLGGGGSAAGANGNLAQASPTAQAIDQAKVNDLMTKYAANPRDLDTLLALGNEFYAGEQYGAAATWFDKALAIDPKNVKALLARGAVSFNLNDLPAAETTWKQVVAIDPRNAEVHYDLGFLYLNQPTPDWAGVQREWTLVTQLDPGSQLAKTVQSHLDALAASSMLPAASGSPVASPATSPVASPAASPQP